MNNNKIFIKAEILVARHYESQDWKVLAHQYRCVGSEIDLIVMKRKMLVFVEVKYRRAQLGSSFTIDQLLGYKKRQALWCGAQHFLTRNLLDYSSCRFDLVVVRQSDNNSGARDLDFKVHQNVM
jgi:uncharacterized protein (TIGR00252 family)